MFLEVYERDIDSEPSDIEIDFSLDAFDEANIYENEFGETFKSYKQMRGKTIKRVNMNIKRELDVEKYVVKIEGEPNYKKRLALTKKIFDIISDKNLSLLIAEMAINSYYLGCEYADQDIIDKYILMID